ncbi:MAG: LysR family transcriptional regulator [Bdellovibrio sp.]|nr:LysR family transcriptional regulator [Bdellovibrio sp.]
MTLPNLYYLKYFADAVDLGSVSAAAQKNLVTHPAVSKAIQILESQMDIKLLEHKKKSFEVTPAGRRLAKRAKALLSATNMLSSAHLETEESFTGTVRLGINRTLAHVYLAPLLLKLAKGFPDMKVTVEFGTTAQIGEAIARGTIDLGLTIGQPSLGTIKATSLKNGQFTLIRAKDKPFGKNISSQNFILTEPRLETEILKNNFYRKFKMGAIIKYEVGSWDMITDLTCKGLGVGLVPDICLTKDLKKKLTAVKPNWLNCDYDIYLVRSKSVQRNSVLLPVAAIFEASVK